MVLTRRQERRRPRRVQGDGGRILVRSSSTSTMVGACIAHSTKNDAKGERQGIRLFTRPVFDEPIVAGSFVTAHHRKPADSPGFCQVASGDDVAGSGLLVRDLGGGVRASAVRERGVPGQVVIRTPDRRLRVFVSSTLGELAEERRAVARAVSALRLTPVMFEVGARPHPPRDVYRAYVAQSDVWGCTGSATDRSARAWRSRVWRTSWSWREGCLGRCT
jgi:Domain of unknown function (DUF4062)